MAHVNDHVLAFNDLHCALAAARSPDPDDVMRMRRSLDDEARRENGHYGREVMAEVGRPLIEGVLAFADGDYRGAVEAILPVRYAAFRIGGSHAQRSIVNPTLIAAAERSGQWSLARALLAERLRAPAHGTDEGGLRNGERTRRALSERGRRAWMQPPDRRSRAYRF